MILNNKTLEDLIINMTFFFSFIQTQKKTCGKKKNNQSPRTVPLITMNPQAIKKTIRKDKEKIAR